MVVSSGEMNNVSVQVKIKLDRLRFILTSKCITSNFSLLEQEKMMSV